MLRIEAASGDEMRKRGLRWGWGGRLVSRTARMRARAPFARVCVISQCGEWRGRAAARNAEAGGRQ